MEITEDDLIDNSTNSNVGEVTTTHLHLNATLDFEKETMHGSVTLSMKSLVDDLKEVILDSRYLDIQKVVLDSCDAAPELDFYFTEENPNIGSALHIKLEKANELYCSTNDAFNLTVSYSTTNQSLSLNWLDPQQTVGKVYPYVFTHCEAIDCRTLLPVQDSPSVKATYTAMIKAPHNLTVHMTGNTTSEDVVGEHKYTAFSMDVPIPSYLIALVAGNIVYAQTGPRTGVVSEPEFIDMVWKELKDLENTLIEAEKFLPVYQWGVYNVVVLPPSFPTGGMENPLLTFVSPTIIVGDKSEIFVTTHELAHSWSGNLITNRNWENFWLNEGVTVYTERHITRRQMGDAFYRVQATFGNSSLFSAFEDLGIDTTFTSLHPNYEGANPYDTFSEVPYEKGFQFLTFIESLIGQAMMEKFLYRYFETFKFQSIVYKQFWNLFQDFLNETFSAGKVKEINSKIDLDTWVHAPGKIPVELDFSTPEIGESRALAQEYIKLAGKESPKNSEDFYGYFSGLKSIFVQDLLDHIDQIDLNIIKKLDEDYDLSNILDPEIKTIWFQICILKKYNLGMAHANDFMVTNGRMKFLLPLYKAWNIIDHDTAVGIYKTGSLIYHIMAKSRIEKILF